MQNHEHCIHSRPRGYTKSYSTQLNIKFQMLISINIYTKEISLLGLNKPRMLFLMLINVKLPTVVGILTFMSRKS